MNNELHMYDLSGSHRVYTTEPASKSLANVCFSSHSIPADLLTTCFDEDFLHGEAEETCMCGDENPHLHAHMQGGDCNGNEMGLTKVKLVLKDTQNKPSFSVTKMTPTSCNSSARVSAVRTAIKVAHGDHEDYLAIASDGSLLLAHDSDKCCDGVDFHGALTLVARRQLSPSVAMTFFKLEEKEFNILDYVLPSLNESIDDPRVEAIGMEEVFSRTSPTRRSGKSTIHVTNICCASEVPPITEICESLQAVTKVTVNVTNKLVYVYHDYETTSADSIVEALNYGGFGATLKKDAR
jgi:copper chaperone CopZ